MNTPMKVLFTFSGDFKRVTGVIWENDDGDIVERILMPSGTTRDKTLNFDTLLDVRNQLGRSMYPLYPAEVADVRTAFKYMGKAADLVELLPEADLDEQPDLPAA